MRRVGTERGRRARRLYTAPPASADERGLTLIELLVTMMLTLIVCGATLSLIVVAVHEQNSTSSRAFATRQAEAGLGRLVRDLGQAMAQSASGAALSVTVSSSGATNTVSLAFSVPTPGSDATAQSVTWTCPSTANASAYVGTCTRTAGGVTVTEINGVQSLEPLAADGSTLTLPATNPAYVGLRLTVQVISQLDHTQPATHILNGTGAASANPVVIQSGVDLRNFA